MPLTSIFSYPTDIICPFHTVSNDWDCAIKDKLTSFCRFFSFLFCRTDSFRKYCYIRCLSAFENMLGKDGDSSFKPFLLFQQYLLLSQRQFQSTCPCLVCNFLDHSILKSIKKKKQFAKNKELSRFDFNGGTIDL